MAFSRIRIVSARLFHLLIFARIMARRVLLYKKEQRIKKTRMVARGVRELEAIKV